MSFTTVGWALPPSVALFALASRLLSPLGAIVAPALAIAVIFACFKAYQGVRARGHTRYVVAYEALVLGALPLWGLGVNYTLSERCVHNATATTSAPWPRRGTPGSCAPSAWACATAHPSL